MRKDKLTKKQRGLLMARIKSKNTNFEKRIFSELKKKGLRFRTHYEGIIGKPDVALPKFQKAVFLHSDFWHGWRFPEWEAVLPSAFWKKKITKNRIRDRFVVRTLRRNGWKVLVAWEHQIKRQPEETLEKIVKFLS